ncbi:aldo/keto reductase [Arthrobacter sp. MI7-26]|uniref:aldo/keto reductase n=1 Tax=Arthrobacter sp. MI7-26 TaxID=2993653 RepID=UPI0022492243|nr:aldo/keto reductase [Arthrobacter sp. MI7-26]MCX2750073.1 aldo/keto reductase [Arthrobacter sp. MI7-26]
MESLRAEGIVDNVGVAGGPVDLLARYINTDIFDVVLTHNRYSLLDRSADWLLDLAAHRGMGVVNAAPYGGGMLARGPQDQPKYAYGQGGEATPGRAFAMQLACREYAVPLAAAALQFSIRDKRISSTVVGVSSPDRIDQTLDLLRHPIPEALWDNLQKLTPPSDEWLG